MCRQSQVQFRRAAQSRRPTRNAARVAPDHQPIRQRQLAQRGTDEAGSAAAAAGRRCGRGGRGEVWSAAARLGRLRQAARSGDTNGARRPAGCRCVSLHDQRLPLAAATLSRSCQSLSELSASAQIALSSASTSDAPRRPRTLPSRIGNRRGSDQIRHHAAQRLGGEVACVKTRRATAVHVGRRAPCAVAHPAAPPPQAPHAQQAPRRAAAERGRLPLTRCGPRAAPGTGVQSDAHARAAASCCNAA